MGNENPRKSEFVKLRVEPQTKRRWQSFSAREHRTLSDLIASAVERHIEEADFLRGVSREAR